MASPITLRSPQKYEVFLSCRPEDTPKNFADHLYTALKKKGFAAFIEHEGVEGGNEISFDSLKAIKESGVSIVILSKNYASSPECLDELVKIVEIMSGSQEYTVLPVFYDVDPSDVRKQKGDFGKAFHENEEYDQQIVKNWRQALVKVAGIKGYPLQNRYEARVIQEIVEETSTKLGSSSSTTFAHVQRFCRDMNFSPFPIFFFLTAVDLFIGL